MKLPSKPKSPLASDPDPVFRYEREKPLDGGGRQAVTIALTNKTLRWLVLSSIAAFGAYQNFDAALPLLTRLLLR
ncbi:hypothetical protein [Pinisolibacter sp.]|uniref:hypothetical protein n=1 Tax=Pinisolibacter sp. TaxID=2172024 RepID=UPI002FDE9625